MSTDNTINGRHTPLKTVEKAIKQQVPVSYQLPGNPQCRIQIEPQTSMIKALVKNDESNIDIHGFENISMSTVTIDGSKWKAVEIYWGKGPITAYNLISS